MVLLLLLISALFGYGSGYYVMPEVVTIVESPVDTLVCEGCRLELTCTILYQNTAANLPQPEIKWMVNGTDSSLLLSHAQIVSDTIRNSTGDFTISSLTISNVRLEHQGSYRCVVVDGNDTANCHSNTPPRFPCVPLVTISREATVEVLDNTTISERNSADNLYDSSTPCNITSRKETMFIDPGSVNATIELRCPIDECVSVSDIVWYHNGEEMSASEVSGNATQLYGVYQCFVSSNGGHSVEASITRVLPHGLTNPPSEPRIFGIARANDIVYLAGVYIEWTPPSFIGNRSNDDLQYRITWNNNTTLSIDTWTEIFLYINRYEVHITVISSVGNKTSENSPVTIYEVTEDHCIQSRVRFPPKLTLSCTDGGFNLSWVDSPRNEAYSRYSSSRVYYARSLCTDTNSPQPVREGNYTSPIVRPNLYEVGTYCWFAMAATIPNNLQCNYSLEYNFAHECYCFDPDLIEYTEEYCQVTGTLHFEHITYFTQENETTIEVCVAAEGYGFTADIMTVDVTAKGGEDFSAINQTLSFDIYVRTRCVNISIFNDAILEDNETFQVILSGVKSSLVNVTTDSILIEIIDDDYITANVTVSSDITAEGGPPLEVCVQLPTIEKNVTLHVTTYDNSAEIEEDFVLRENQLVFTPTSSETQCVNITIIDDELLETMESFIVVLKTSNTSRVLISEEWFEIQIEDNDEVTVALSETSFPVSEETGSPLRVCARVSGSLGRSVSVGVVAVDNTAVGGEDYNLTESQLQFNASHYNDCVNIIIINDDVLEDRERFTVMLSGADSEDVRVSNQTVTVEIEDDDYVTVSLSASSFNIIEPLGGEMPMNICVVVEGSFARSESVVVFIEVTEGSASNGSDYTGDDASFIFHQDGPAMLCNDSIISVKGDDVIEYEEYFNISLSLPSSENPESVQYGALSHAMVAIQETVSNDCTSSVRFDSEEKIYDVYKSNSTLRITIILETTCRIERNLEVSVKTEDGFGAKENINFEPLDTVLLFNDTTRRNMINIQILDLPRNESKLRFFVRISGSSDYFDVYSAEVILHRDDGVSLGPLEAGFLGSVLALVVFLVILSVITVLCVKCDASTKRKNHYLDSNEFEGWECSPIAPEERDPIRDPIDTKDDDRWTVLDYLSLETPATPTVMDYRDTKITTVILDVQRHSVHEQSETETLQDPIPQESNSEIAKHEVLPVTRRKMSGSSTSRTDSLLSQPYVQCIYDNSGNAICQCPHCVSQRSGENIEQLLEESFLVNEINPSNQLPKTSDKYMNTLTIIDSEQLLQGDITNVTSPSEHSVPLLDVTPTRLMSETRHALCEKHKLEVEETELAVRSLEVEDASPQFIVDTSVGCGQASSDDLS